MSVRKIVSEQKGAVAIMFGLGIVAFLSFTAIVADIGFILVTKNELHNVADASALAGTRQLGKIYEGLTTFGAQQDYTLVAGSPDDTLIKNAVLDVAAKSGITIDPDDICIGQWDGKTRKLELEEDPDKCPDAVEVKNPDAVKVTARRDVTTLFAKLMGIKTPEVVKVNVTSTSKREGGLWTGVERPTAALTGVSKVGPGEVDIPVGIGKTWFTDGLFCDKPIVFHPTKESCTGWHTFMRGHGGGVLKQVLQEMVSGDYEAPGLTAYNDSVDLTGGDVSSAFDDLEALYNQNRDVTGVWETFLVVYDNGTDPTCLKNPSGSTPIVGFASARITEVTKGEIKGTVECKLVQPNTRGGGADYGTKGSIPGLVE